MVAAQRGYRCIFVMPDKMSREKIALLRAFGAEVVVCPTEVEPEDPRSYYSVSLRLTAETPGAFNPNQYAQSGATRRRTTTRTGPEIWEQVGDELDVLVTGVGTGGTVTGTGRYLKERKPDLQIVGADPIGSIYSSEQVHSYLVEGVGEDFWPTTFDRDIVDRWIRVSDREAFAADAPHRARGGHPDRRLGRHGPARRADASPPSCRPSKTRARDPARRRPAVPLEGLQRRLDARARHVRRHRAAAHRGRARGRAQRRRARARERRPAAARRRRDRAAAALRRLAAARDRRAARWSAACTSARCSTARCATAAGRSRRRRRS